MSTKAAQLDAIVLGDSQAIALKEGCDQLGLRTALMSLSGNFWHMGLVRYNPSRGIVGRGAAQARVNGFKAENGFEKLPHPGLPVIATFGFHLGRILPMFGIDGHRTRAEEFEEDLSAHFVSRGMMRAYARAFRQAHFDMLKRLTRQVPTLLVAPPLMSEEGNMVDFRSEILAMMREAGIDTLDPCAEIAGADRALPAVLRAPDNNHGNADYGRQAVELVCASGFLARPEIGAVQPARFRSARRTI
jgi:hypothetical protein